MPLRELRVINYRSFADSGSIRLAPCSAIVGRNDVGKSGLLSALKTFFEPPKKGLPLSDIHLGNPDSIATIELAFDPACLVKRVISHRKHELDVLADMLTDQKRLLRLRVAISAKRVEKFEICTYDFPDPMMSPLALKSEDQVDILLSALDGQVAANATIAEKRAGVRDAAKKRGITPQDTWFDGTDIEPEIRSILPEFLYFTDTSNYSISQTGVQNQFRSIVDRAIGQHPSATALEQQMRTLVQAEFDKLFEELGRLTDSVTGLEASATVSWKKAVDGVELRWRDESGFETQYERRGAGIRRLFMVAYFQYEAAAFLHDPAGKKYVFAIEEPEVHLHPGAQRSLLEAFKSLSKRGHTILFTTHSPVFAANTPLEGITLVHKNAKSSETVQTPNLDLVLVAEELGVEAPDRLVGRNYVLLVEGPRDVEFYSTVLEELYKASQTKLDPSKIFFLHCGGVETMKFAVASRSMDKAGLKWAVIGDSDRKAAGDPENPVYIDLRASKPTTCLAIEVLERTAIENYLDAGAIKVVTSVECVVPHYGLPTEASGKPLKERDLNLIKRASAKVARQMGAAALLKNATLKNGRSEWKELFERLRVAFGL